MKQKQSKSPGSPYKILYWMGAGVVLLLLGVGALALLTPKPEPANPPDPERTLLWMYDSSNPSGPAAAVIIEESRGLATLSAVPFAAPEEARQVFATKKSLSTTELIGTKLNRQIHHRVFLPYTVVVKLIDAAKGITVDGKEMSGTQATAYIQEGGEKGGARRGAEVMLSLAKAVSNRGIDMGLSDGLSLAGQVDTDLDLMALPRVLGRWTSYQAPKVENPTQADYPTLEKLLLPDPVAPEKK